MVAADSGATCTACDAPWTVANNATQVIVPPRDAIVHTQDSAHGDRGQVLDARALETEGVLQHFLSRPCLVLRRGLAALDDVVAVLPLLVVVGEPFPLSRADLQDMLAAGMPA